MSLYVNFEPPATLKEFLYKFFSFETYDRILSVETYFDEECNNRHCSAGKNRSFDDVYEVVLTYYPETSIVELLNTIFLLDIKSKSGDKRYFYASICDTINRTIMMFYSKALIYNSLQIEHYWIYKPTNSKWSWMELFQICDPIIETQEDLNIYINKLKEKELENELI